MTKIGYRDGVAIGELIFYVPAFVVAIVLILRHGFGLLSGWRFLALFTLARILQACFQLATISQPNSETLYSGVFVLLNIAVSPLQLTALGLLSRVLCSINRNSQTFLAEIHLHIVMLINFIGLILIIVGGVESGNSYSNSGVYTPAIESKVGEGIFIFTFVAICAATAILSLSISHAESGEKRILLTVALALPFLLTRLVYACIQVYGNSRRFNSIDGDVTILLCMALLEELLITYMWGLMGLTLKKTTKEKPAAPGPGGLQPGYQNQQIEAVARMA